MEVGGAVIGLDIDVDEVRTSDIVELDVGGVRYVTSLTTLRSRPGSMLDAMFSGNYQIEEEEGSGAFLDRDDPQLKLDRDLLISSLLYMLMLVGRLFLFVDLLLMTSESLKEKIYLVLKK